MPPLRCVFENLDYTAFLLQLQTLELMPLMEGISFLAPGMAAPASGPYTCAIYTGLWVAEWRAYRQCAIAAGGLEDCMHTSADRLA